MNEHKKNETVAVACFEDRYSPQRPYFGLEPSAWLGNVAGMFNGTRPARCLDLGCGHGRNALYMAARGFDVVAVDSSPVATDFLARKAAEEGLQVDARCADIQNLVLEPQSFDLVMVVTALGGVSGEKLGPLAERIESALRDGGLAAIEEFAAADPGAAGRKGASEFSRLVQHYFSIHDIERLFSNLNTLSCKEFRVWDTSHGAHHEHHLIHYVGRKEGAAKTQP